MLGQNIEEFEHQLFDMKCLYVQPKLLAMHTERERRVEATTDVWNLCHDGQF